MPRTALVPGCYYTVEFVLLQTKEIEGKKAYEVADVIEGSTSLHDFDLKCVQRLKADRINLRAALQ